ncbi:glycosyltransferase family 2 protein [Nocardioides terrisoli]|uniref:glycosyltransferase family 2 protein n=1 Tax=Nocardioides terrisoli TaxID=3388267 RepID=UPI00287B9BBD|nr:glycosyltransferase [Nocardioides marmorisolisilvae]
MSAFLAQLLLTALVLAVPATVALLAGHAGQPRISASLRGALLAVGTALVALIIGLAAEATPTRSVAVAVVLAVAVLVNVPAAAPWTLRGLAVWSLTIAVGAAYLVYVAHWLVVTPHSIAVAVGGWLLWLLELFVYVLALGYVWELVDVLARWDWRRTQRAEARVEELAIDGAEAPGRDAGPFVSLHVPTHNEPPDLVIATLQSLLDLDYDDYEVLLLDNNTDDEALWRPVEAFCEGHRRLRFVHLDDWPGYKSGALNYGLTITDPRAEVIGVVDADYQVQPDFLARCAPLFADDRLAFMQSPQDYRDWQTDPYFRRLYYSYAYFFEVSQRSRNERNGAIFGGTMGLIRRSALIEVGAWDEWCITEDAELSLRLLRAGWNGTHVPESFGAGIMPLTFEALKRQRFRWCFGGVQILRMHWRSLLPWGRGENRLSMSQRWAYLVGGLQWFGDLASLVFTAFLLVGAVSTALGHGAALRQLSGPLLFCVVGLVLLGPLRSVALLRRTGATRWRDAFGAFLLWLSLGWCVAFASVRGLVAREGAFLRTPKTRGDVGWRDALRGNLIETALALVCLVGVALGTIGAVGGRLGGAAVAVLLLVQAVGYAAAPANSLAAVRADLTPELRRRRRDARLSWTRVRPGVRRWGLGPVLVAAVAVAALVVLANPVGGPPVSGLAHEAVPDHPGRAHPRAPHRTPTPSPVPGTQHPTPVPLAPSSVLTTAAASPTRAAVTNRARTSSTPRPTRAASSTGRPSSRPTQAATPTAKPTSKPTQAATPTAKPTSRPTQAATPTRRPTHSPRSVR